MTGTGKEVIRRRVVTATPERLMLTGMIVSSTVLRGTVPLFKIAPVDILESTLARRVAGWCLAFHEQYDRAPGEDIRSVFEAELKRGNIPPDEEDLLTEFLSSLSDQYERGEAINAPYILDIAEKHLTKRALARMGLDLREALAQDDVETAQKVVTEYRNPIRPVSAGVNPLTNAEAIQTAFEQAHEDLFHLPGALGDLLRHEFTRDAFVAIMAPEKRGKSWWLMEWALRAVRARCNVAFFEAGDMSQNQIVRRIHMNLAGRSDNPSLREVIVPVLDCKHSQAGGPCPFHPERDWRGTDLDPELAPEDLYPAFLEGKAPGHRPCCECYGRGTHFQGTCWYERKQHRALTWRDALRTGNQFSFRLKGRDFRLSVHPARTLTGSMIRSRLQAWQEDGWIPDVIVIDYADIMAAEDTRQDARHQENDKWISLRALSMEWHCLVLTATQASARAYDRESIRLGDFSEDKRKYGHVTCTVALNQTPEEKRAGVMRLGILVRRNDDFYVGEEVKVLQALSLGRPLLASYR